MRVWCRLSRSWRSYYAFPTTGGYSDTIGDMTLAIVLCTCPHAPNTRSKTHACAIIVTQSAFQLDPQQRMLMWTTSNRPCLPLCSLTKEIQLTQDLMEMFIKFVIFIACVHKAHHATRGLSGAAFMSIDSTQKNFT